MSQLKNKRILIFLRSFEIGGAERQAVMLANYLLHTEKAKVAVWAYSKKGPALDFLDKRIPWKSVSFNIENQKPENIKKRKWDLLKLAIRIRFFKPDVILPFTIGPNVDCGYIWRWTRAKSCIWNQRDEWLNFSKNTFETQGFVNTPVFVSNSRTGIRLIKKKLHEFNQKAELITFIPNATSAKPNPAKHPDWRKKLNITKGVPIVTMVANLHTNKDHVSLLKAWKIVLKEYKFEVKPILILAGRYDNNYGNIKALANTLGIKNQVLFTGFVKDIAGLLKITDIGILSSESEGGPNVILEYMQAGLPVIASDISGIRNILGKDYQYCINTSDKIIFANKILELLKNENKRQIIGKTNKKKANALFNPNKIFKQYSELLEKLV